MTFNKVLETSSFPLYSLPDSSAYFLGPSGQNYICSKTKMANLLCCLYSVNRYLAHDYYSKALGGF